MSARSGPHTNIRTAATYVANATWYSTTAFQMGPQANTLLLYCTVGTASAGNIDFYIQHSQDGTTYFDLCSNSESPEIFGPLAVAGADTRSIIIKGLPPLEYVQVYFRCSAGAGSATLGITALSYLDESGVSNAEISIGDVEVSVEVMDDWDGTEDVALGTGHDGCVTLFRSADLDGAAIPTRGSAEGDAVIPVVTNQGVPYAMLATEDGADTPTIPLDAAPASGEGTAVVMAGTRVADFDGSAIPALAGTQNDACALATTGQGVAYTVPVCPDGSGTPLATHDEAIATGVGVECMMAGAEAETLAALSTVNADGDATRLKASTSGVLHVGLTDPTGATDVGTAIKTAVEIMDDWDESDRAKVNPIAGQVGIAANAGAMDALTTRVTVATDDTHFGAVGTASDVDGVIHGQLRYMGEFIATIDADTGAIKTAVEIMDDWDATHDSAIGADGATFMAEYKDFDGAALPNAVSDEGDAVRIAATANGVQYVFLVDETGSKTLVLAEDAAHATADRGIQSLAVRNDALATLCDTDGDYTPLQVNAAGALYTEVATMPGGLTGFAEDVAHTTADVGVEVLAVRNDALATLCDTDGDYAPLQVDANGALYVSIGAQSLTAVAISADNAANATGNRIWVTNNMDQVAGTATASNRGTATAGAQRVVEAQDIVVVNATGAGAVATTTSISANYQLESVTCKFSAAPTTSEAFTITLDANDGTGEYDAVLYSIDPSATAATSIVYLPDRPIVFESGDEIAVAFTNTDARTYGLRIVVRKI